MIEQTGARIYLHVAHSSDVGSSHLGRRTRSLLSKQR
jgi:hypothetical protein